MNSGSLLLALTPVLALVQPCLTCPLQGEVQRTDPGHDWGQWRGPLATGVAPWANPPVEWSEQKNVRWKTPLPGHGLSSPVVWGDRVFVTTAVPTGDVLEPRPETAPGAHDNVEVRQRHEFVALGVSRADGKVLWRRVLKEELPHEGGHDTGSYASASPATDGEHVFAFFGSRGLFALDTDGAVLWEADLGDMQTKHAHGEGASPVLFGDTLVVNWDHEGQSFVLALDKATGEERWRAERDEVTSWASPIVARVGEDTQVIVSATGRIRGYDLDTGEVLWSCGGMSHNVVASPIFADGVLYAASSYEKQAMLALNIAGARGDVSLGERVLWYRRRNTPYVPSPLLYEGSLYVLHHYQGVLSRLLAETGEPVYRSQRLAGIGNVYASPVAAAGRVYVTDLDGTTAVLEPGNGEGPGGAGGPRVLALNHLEDSFSASAALAGDALFLRGDRFLYCIAED